MNFIRTRTTMPVQNVLHHSAYNSKTLGPYAILEKVRSHYASALHADSTRSKMASVSTRCLSIFPSSSRIFWLCSGRVGPPSLPTPTSNCPN